MHFFSPSRQWLLLLVFIVANSCQRANYQFDSSPAVERHLPPLAEPSESATIGIIALPVAMLPERQAFALRPIAHRLVRSSRTSAANQRLLPHLRVGNSPAAWASVTAQPRQKPLPGEEPERRLTRGIAFLLAIFLGGFGIHLFYLGYHKRAITYLILSLVGSTLVFIGFFLFLLALFSSGGGAAFVAPLIVGAVMLNAISVLALVDAVRILTNSLKPSNGEYYQRFFQTRPRPTDQTSPR